MKKIKFKTILACLLLILTIGAVSCKKDKEPEAKIDQLFRPSLFTAVVNGNEVALSWTPIANASYLLEISKDNLFQNEVQVVRLENATYQLTDLWSSTPYAARIKAVSKDQTVKDSQYNQIAFTTGVENIFFTTEPAAVTTSSVLLKWNAAKQVSEIAVSATGITPYTVLLAPADATAGEKLISGLRSGVNYTFRIYNGGMLRGTVTVMTK